jgi:isopropylmalate/homocitrate/citramalate synthase
MSDSLDREIILDPQGRWWCSRLNRLPEVQAGSELASRVHIRDCTLREGEEKPGTFLSVERKVALGRLAQEIGIEELEVGYCGAIDAHFALARRLRQEGISVRLTSINRTYTRDGEWQREIDRAAESGVDGVSLVVFCNDDLLASVPWLPKEAVPERVEFCVRYAKSLGLHVGYGLAGTSRSELRWIEACARAAARAGADLIGVTDSMGAALPETVAFLTRFVRRAVGPESVLGFHGHSTFGLATANALAALRAGATVVDAVAMGLGEGAGITALEEIGFALEVLYDVRTGLNVERVGDYCRMVQESFGVCFPPTKTIVGDGLYRHSIDSHQASILRGRWHSWECIHPRVVGQERRLEFGHAKVRRGRSGAIGALVEKLGLVSSDAQIDAIVDRVQAVTAERHWIEQADVESIIRDVLEGAMS